MFRRFLVFDFHPDLVTDPVHGIFTLTQVLDQFLGLKKTHSLFFCLLKQEVPQSMQLLQTSLFDREKLNQSLLMLWSSFM